MSSENNERKRQTTVTTGYICPAVLFQGIYRITGEKYEKLQYTFKTDTLFKMLFVKYPELLKELVANLLGIPSGSIGQFTIKNPEMPPENLGDKFCRLDINMTVNGQQVDLEVQVSNEGDYPERVMYYWAR